MLPPQIYYDARYSCYINPILMEEQGSCEYISSELAKTGCIYHFYLGNERDHSHTISEVLMEAYNESESFSISIEDKHEYSEQELNLILKLVERGKIDRKNYRE